MSIIKTIIVDDEPGNVITLTKLLQDYCPNIELIGTATNVKEAEEAIHKLQPQLIFLDIEMPDGSGFDLLNNIAPINFEVVFVTAFNAYALQAFKYAAIDYILKPVSIIELKNAVNKVSVLLEKTQINKRIDLLLQNIKSESVDRKKIGISTVDGYIFEELSEIMYLESDKNYTIIYIKNGRKEVVSKSIGEMEELLPNKLFCRIHKCYLININYIKKYLKGRGGTVIMEDGINIEVSSRKKDDFLKLIEQ